MSKETVKDPGIAVVLGSREMEPSAASLALVQKAAELAEKLAGKVTAVWMKPKAAGNECELGTYGADEVIILESEACREYQTESDAGLLAGALKVCHPQIILFEAGFTENDLAARLAVRLRAGLVTDAAAADIDEDGCLRIQRLSDDGTRMFVFTCDMHTVQMVTLPAAGVDETKMRKQGTAGVRVLQPEKQEISGIPVLISASEKSDGCTDITKAKILVAGGRGAGGREGFLKLEELACLLHAEVATSRPNVDEGWIGKERQVGLSGKRVSPRLYLAFGISGSAHHIIGMEQAETVIAVNMDRNAPIFDAADLGIVGDAGTIAELLTERLKLSQ